MQVDYIQNRAITLLEILTVIIIIAILAALALPNFGAMKERALDKEAKANLKLIQAAQKIYRMEVGYYYPRTGSAATGAINIDLRLFLSATNWGYSIESATDTTFEARSTRDPPGDNWDRNYRIDHADEEACCEPQDSRCPSQDWRTPCP